MANTRKLIIHIGSHKTGTTAIQRSLFAHQETLKEYGFELFNFDPDGSQPTNGHANSWIRFQPGNRIEGKIREGLARELRAMAGNVIISAEHFSWVFDESELQKFHGQLQGDFDEFRVIAYIRRQDQQAVSHYQQGSEFRAFAATRYYDGNFRALPAYRDRFQLYLDYFQRIGMWGNVFGDENIIVRVFDRQLLKNGDAVADFFSAIGLDISTSTIRVNESRSFEQTKLGHLMNRTKVPKILRKQLLQYSDSTGKLLPGREAARAFYLRFREGNRLLNEKYGVNDNAWLFDESFDMYPVEAQDIWSEESANRAILNLLEGVNHLPVLEVRDIRLLRKASRRMASIDRERSRALAEMVTRHRGQDMPVSADQATSGPRNIRIRLKNVLRRIRGLL